MASDTGSYDIVILGGGSGGYACALRAAELGRRVALIEKDKVGGTCLHRGCIPTKALLHAAEIADQSRESAKFGINASFDGVDMPGVLAYQNSVVDRLWKGLQSTIASRKVEVVAGSGRLVSPTAVRVGDTVYEAGHVVLATGSQPRSLPGLDLDGERVITSDEALVLDRVPQSVIVLGGGVIGVEFARLWRSFGADVTIVEMMPQLLPLEDESSARLLQRAFRRRGIRFELGAMFESVKHTGTGVSVALAGGKTLEAELLLVAVGRGPVSAGLGYEDSGVALDRGYVVVDELCRTSVPTISAIGDLIATPQLAHVGFAEGILVAERVSGLDVKPIDYPGVPRITYSDPEVAAVGLTSAQAAERGLRVVEVSYPLGANGRSVILQTQGEAKVIAEAGPDGAGPGRVLGIHLVGSRVGELIAEGQLIYNWDAEPADLAQLIHPHPTQSEIIGEAHLALAGKPLHFHA
ncbi:MAG TPA: dihydrolipoyl dehydrogenase [Streptosporangiaceae bacterium]|nr:dihydrolipoyl dehydrogenase [Streptosporangiaceae bacterium]